MLDVTRAYELDFRFPERDAVIGPSLKYFGEFARTEVDFLSAHMDGTGSLLDVGANIGAISLPLAKAHPDWRILGFEAHRRLAALYAANAISNGLRNVEPFHVAVGSERALAEFPSPDMSGTKNFGETSFADDGAKEPVLMLPLDEVAPTDTRIVKVDVEGFEGEVFKGAKRLLEAGPLWLFEWKSPGASGEHIDLFRAASYDVFWFFAPFVTPTNPKGMTPPSLKGDYNVVASRSPIAWPLPAIGSPNDRPPAFSAPFSYLQRYGIK
jgi:FkbM family methyltransferase